MHHEQEHLSLASSLHGLVLAGAWPPKASPLLLRFTSRLPSLPPSPNPPAPGCDCPLIPTASYLFLEDFHSSSLSLTLNHSCPKSWWFDYPQRWPLCSLTSTPPMVLSSTPPHPLSPWSVSNCPVRWPQSTWNWSKMRCAVRVKYRFQT